MAGDRTRLLRGALAGAAAAGVWAAQQPADKRLFGIDYDDCLLLGTAVTRGRAAYPVGLAMHLANGALFGALYAALAPSLPGPRFVRGTAAGLAEHLATWPLTRLAFLHPAAGQLPRLHGNRHAFAQATWRHLLFGSVLGALEAALNPPADEPAPAGADALVSANGHGDAARLAGVRA